MTPEAIAARNRANSGRSTGPKTAAGKAAVAGNARRHGAQAKPDPESVAAWLRVILDEPHLATAHLIPEDERGLRALALATAEARLAACETALRDFQAGAPAAPSQEHSGSRAAPRENRLPDGDPNSLMAALMHLLDPETRRAARRGPLLRRYRQEARASRNKAFRAWIACLAATRPAAEKAPNCEIPETKPDSATDCISRASTRPEEPGCAAPDCEAHERRPACPDLISRCRHRIVNSPVDPVGGASHRSGWNRKGGTREQYAAKILGERHISTLRTCLAAIIGCALFSAPAMATEPEYTIMVQNYKALPPYSAYEDGNYTGFNREILDMFAAGKGYRFTYVAYPVKRLFFEFVNGAGDFKYPDNPKWQAGIKKDAGVVYSDPVVEYIDGVMVTPKNRGMGLAGLKVLGQSAGWTPFQYLGMIKDGTIELQENNSYPGLLKQTILGRNDGAYSNIATSRYYLKNILDDPDGLVFAEDLPHIRSGRALSSIKHPEIIAEFNAFLQERADDVEALKQKYAVEDGVKAE